MYLLMCSSMITNTYNCDPLITIQSKTNPYMYLYHISVYPSMINNTYICEPLNTLHNIKICNISLD